MSNAKKRLQVNEAHMICADCGSRLYSFHGKKDKAVRCPYKEKGKKC